MSAASYRGWRFVFPDFDQAGRAGGLAVNNRGGAAMVEGGASVRQSILMLLSTRPGERVMRPNYGCNLHRLVFSPNDQTTAGLAIHYVRQAIQTWEPRVDVVHLDAVPGTGPVKGAVLEINLEYRVRSTLQSQSMTYPIELMGEHL